MRCAIQSTGLVSARPGGLERTAMRRVQIEPTATNVGKHAIHRAPRGTAMQTLAVALVLKDLLGPTATRRAHRDATDFCVVRVCVKTAQLVSPLMERVVVQQDTWGLTARRGVLPVITDKTALPSA